MSQTKKKAAKSAKPGAQKAPRPLSKATTAELTAVLATRGLAVVKAGTIEKDYPLVDVETSPCVTNTIQSEQPLAKTPQQNTLLKAINQLNDVSMQGSELDQLGIIVKNLSTSDFKSYGGYKVSEEFPTLLSLIEDVTQRIKIQNEYLSLSVMELSKQLFG